MTKKTVTTLSIATVYAFILCAIFLYAVVTVQSEKAEVISLRTTKAEQLQKEVSARTIANTVTLTEAVRKEMGSYFLTEKDTISFIADIEKLAAVIGVKIETTNLAMVAASSTPSSLQTGFSVQGSRPAVLRFMKALETLPYHNRLPKLTVERSAENLWQGQVEVVVTIMPTV